MSTGVGNLETSPGQILDFFDQNKPSLQALFAAAGQNHLWSDSLDELVDATQPWTKGDHFQARNPIQVSDADAPAVRESFRSLALLDAVYPPSGEYDELVILGGTMRANQERTEFGADLLARAEDPITLTSGGALTFWAGPRKRMDDKELPHTRISLNAVKNKEVNSLDNWFKRQLYLPESEHILTETEQGRLSLLRYFGEIATARQIHLRLGQSETPNIISHYVMGAYQDAQLTLMNALPVSRADMQGAARHTTESCTLEWLKRKDNLDKPQRVLFVSSNPYVRRTTKVVEQVLRKNNVGTIELTGCGPSAYDDAPMSLLFGEVARLLYTTNQERKQTEL